MISSKSFPGVIAAVYAIDPVVRFQPNCETDMRCPLHPSGLFPSLPLAYVVPPVSLTGVDTG